MGLPIVGAIMVGLSIADMLFGVAGDRKAAKQAKKLGEFEGAMFDESAEDALKRGTLEGYRVGAAARGLKGAQVTSMAAQGIEVNSGSAAELIASDQRLADLDIQTITNNAQLEAHGLRQQGEYARMGGKNAASAYSNRATGTLLSGAADLYRTYDRFGLNRGNR